MEDKDILNWLQEHITSFREYDPGKFVMEWVDLYGITKKTTGDSLRVCVMKTFEGMFDGLD